MNLNESDLKILVPPVTLLSFKVALSNLTFIQMSENFNVRENGR